MPLYEYSCEKCSRKIELLIRGDEKPECPHCHSTKLTKLTVISGFFIFLCLIGMTLCDYYSRAWGRW